MVKETDKEHVLSKRFHKIQESRIENSPETIEALRELSTFYKENTLHARRILRSQIEKRSLDINLEFLNSFKQVKESFDHVYKDISDMSQSMREMKLRLQNTKTQTKDLLQKTSILQEEKATNTQQQDIASAFLETFQLRQDEIVALHGDKTKRIISLTPATFKALDRVHEIHENCKVLMQAGLQPLALDIMEQMTLHQEGAMETIYRWTQSQCRNVTNPDMADILARAMSKLQERPVLFKYVIDEYCVARRSYLADEFLNALTRGGPSGNPAPIETRAHDPQIYITDMLVWINKFIPVERQNLLSLVKLCEFEELDGIVSCALAAICEGICQPLKLRVEKILNTPTQASVLYAVVNLLRYYKKCVNKLVNEGLLEETLDELQRNSENVFLTALQQQVNGVLVKVEAPPRDLSPTSAVTHLLAILRDMLSTANMSEGRGVDMVKITNTVLEPLLRAVNEQASRLPPTDMAVYLLNCIYSMYTCLSLYEFMDERLERLQAQSDAQIDTLTSEQASSLVANLNLGPVYTILQDHAQAALSDVPGMEPGNLKKFVAQLEELSDDPDRLLLPQISLLLSSKHKKAVQKRAFDVILAIYKQLYDAVRDPTNGYENPNAILPKAPEEFFALFA
ncbi:conserved oligomeric Golgi complex subunit 6 [Cylas formicarius]|uniref:conserved oligomeric Golgi complex subunit 6 n=1 Tax=Cylas formicarius TaxID=197179 RepID=UPI0029584C65|nr:conserved oligomeric Golgi complex subunit 6 [Cylas formicarius]